jgi:hypothetical protein
MVILLFELNKLFMLITFCCHGSQTALLSRRTKVGGCVIAKKTMGSVNNVKSKAHRWQQQKECDCRVKLHHLLLPSPPSWCSVSAVPKQSACLKNIAWWTDRPWTDCARARGWNDD